MSIIESFMIVNLAWLVYAANVAALSIVVCGAAILAERWARRGPLPLRHLLLVSGLFAVLAAPLLVGLVSTAGIAPIRISTAQQLVPADVPLSRAGSAAVSPVSISPAVPTVPVEQPEIQSNRPTMRPSHRQAGSATAAADRAIAPPAEPASASRALMISLNLLLAVWMAGTVYESIRLIRGLVAVRRLLNQVQGVDDPRIERNAHEAARRLGLRRLPPICQSAEIEAPMSVGLVRCRVVLPAGHVIDWSDSAWRAILVHELAHVQRGDLPLGLAQRLATALYWWNPLARILSARISVLREQICDDLVTQHGSRDDGYAAILVELAGRIAGCQSAPTVLGAVDGAPGSLTERVRRLLQPERVLTTALSRRQKLMAAVFGLALLAGIGGTTVRWAEAVEQQNAQDNTLTDTANGALTAVEDAKAAAPLQKKVRIVDLEGKPVAGAKVEPWAIRSAQGHGSWAPGAQGDSKPPIVETDDKGIAKIPFPRYAIAEERLPIQELTCKVEHPDFATTRYNNVDVRPDALDEVTEIKIAPGTLVTITPRADGEKLDRRRLFAIWSSPTDSYKLEVSDDGKLRLPRLPSEDTLFRVVYLPKNAPVMFSDVLSEDLSLGKTFDLAADLHPAVVVTGTLSDNVPRPVSEGVVLGDVTLRTENGFLIWRVSAEVRPDGTFEITDVPRNSALQLIAVSKGFMASSGQPPAGSQELTNPSFSMPQVFELGTQPTKIMLDMTPTAECAVHVVDEMGKPIAGARCTFWPNVKWWNGGSQIYCHPIYSGKEVLEDEGFDGIEELQKQPSRYEATTDAEGNAVVKNLPHNILSMAVTADGYEVPIEENNRWRRVDLQKGDRHELTITMQPKSEQLLGDLPPEKLEACVAPGTVATKIVKPTPRVSAKSSPQPTELAGIVVDEDGKPLAGVKVDAWTWHPGNETKTDSEGRFKLKGFDREEPVEIEFTKADYSPSLFIDQQAGTPDWTIVLTQGTALEGRVLDPLGEPVPGAKVRAWRGPFENPGVHISQVWTETTADSDGHYRLNVEPGSYTIEMRIDKVGALRVPNVAVAAKEIKPLDLKLERGTTLAAVVRDSVTGEPVPGIELWNFLQPGIDGTSNEQGLLEIPHMMPGEFDFRVVAKGKRRTELAGKYARWWSPQATKEWEREEKNLDNPLKLPADTPADVKKALERDARVDSKFQRNFDGLTFNLDGNTTAVEIFVEPAVTIKGRVLSPDGDPVAGATVAPAKTGSGNSLTGDTRYSVTTDADGNFTMLAPAGKRFEYNLIAHDGKYQQWRKWANGATEPFKTEPGQTIEGVEIKLTRGGTVTGIVLNEKGQPQPNVEVRAAAVDMRDNRYYLPTTKTGQDGRYELKFVAPGRQHIQVAPFWLRADEAPGPTTKVVEVTSGGNLDGIDFKLSAVADQ